MTAERLPKGDDWVIFGVTPKGYEALAHNMAELRRWMEEIVWRERYYRGELRDDGPGDTNPDPAGR